MTSQRTVLSNLPSICPPEIEYRRAISLFCPAPEPTLGVLIPPVQSPSVFHDDVVPFPGAFVPQTFTSFEWSSLRFSTPHPLSLTVILLRPVEGRYISVPVPAIIGHAQRPTISRSSFSLSRSLTSLALCLTLSSSLSPFQRVRSIQPHSAMDLS